MVVLKVIAIKGAKDSPTTTIVPEKVSPQIRDDVKRKETEVLYYFSRPYL
jgi:hypothetical protein